MRYTGFDTRKFLILDNITINKNLSYLEIGVGLGDVIDRIKGKVKDYYGVDISRELIEYLHKIYSDSPSLHFVCLDACDSLSNLDKKFDFIFSTDTLEHVGKATGFFGFIKRHLSPGGRALVIFPNESSEKHHGILWFNEGRDLIDAVRSAGLNLDTLLEVKPSFWHRLIKTVFYNFPKKIFLRKNARPQTFEETDAFRIIESGGIKTKILTIYLKFVVALAKMFKLYNYSEIKGNIKDKNLLVKLSHIS